MTTLRCDPIAADVRAARQFVTEHLDREPASVRETAELLVAEVATNAVLHAATPFTVEVARTEDRLRVEVCDQARGMPTCHTPQPGQIGGWGMHLVNKLSSAWGAEPVPGDGKRVWFELDLSHPTRSVNGERGSALIPASPVAGGRS